MSRKEGGRELSNIEDYIDTIIPGLDEDTKSKETLKTVAINSNINIDN